MAKEKAKAAGAGKSAPRKGKTRLMKKMSLRAFRPSGSTLAALHQIWHVPGTEVRRG